VTKGQAGATGFSWELSAGAGDVAKLT